MRIIKQRYQKTTKMDLPKKLQDEIWDYCRANKITNIDDFTIKLIKQGFTIEKFGATPNVVEKIIEKVVEIEKIVEVEKIIEVPIAMVDTEISESLKNYIELYKVTEEKLKEALAENLILKEENNKKKKDIYGE